MVSWICEMCNVLYQSKIPGRGGASLIYNCRFCRLKKTQHKLESLLVQAKASEKVESVIREHGLNTDMEKISRSWVQWTQFKSIAVQVEDWSHCRATLKSQCSFVLRHKIVMPSLHVRETPKYKRVESTAVLCSAAHFMIFHHFHIPSSTKPSST